MNRFGRCILGFGFLCSSLLFSVSASAANEGEVLQEGDFEIKVTDEENQFGRVTSYSGLGGVVEIPEQIGGVTVTEIGENLFRYNSDVTKVIVPDTISYIDKFAFAFCDNLSELYIEGSNVTFADRVFGDRTAGEPSTVPNLSVISVPNFSDYREQLDKSTGEGPIGNFDDAFECRHESRKLGCCDAHSSHVYTDGDECIYCGAPIWEIDGTKLVHYNGSEETVVVPENITVLASMCFYGCSAKSILLPDGLLTIESGVFSGLNSLEKIVIPDSCTEIATGNLCNCASLEEIIFSNNITQIGGGCISKLPQLKSVVLPEKLESIGGGVFSSCGSLKEIVFPESLTGIPSGLFSNTPLEKMYVSSTEFSLAESMFFSTPVTISVPNGDKFYKCNPYFAERNPSATVICRHEEKGCCDDHKECQYDKDGFCEICHQPQDVVFLRGASLSLTGEVEVSIYLQYAGPFLNDMDKVSVSISRLGDGNAKVETLVYNATDGKPVQNDGQTYYVYDYSVPVKNMTSQIDISVSDGKARNISYSYSVYEYADHLLELAKTNENYEKYADVTKAMLNYGAAAQEYFKCNTNDLANKSLSDADKAISSEETVKASVANCERKIDGDLPEGVTFYASTMVFYGKPIIRQYFKIADGVDPATYGLVSGANNLYYKDTNPLSIKDLGNADACVVTVGSCNITFTPLAYINAMLNSSSSSQVNKNLCCALYDFYMANVGMQK